VRTRIYDTTLVCLYCRAATNRGERLCGRCYDVGRRLHRCCSPECKGYSYEATHPCRSASELEERRDAEISDAWLNGRIP
jgi:hypothetical protein